MEPTTETITTDQPVVVTEAKERKKPGPKGKKRTVRQVSFAKQPKADDEQPNATKQRGVPDFSTGDTIISKPVAAPALAPTDQAFDFSGYNPLSSGQQELPWRPGFDHLSVSVRYFRHDQLTRLNGSVQAGYWIPVTLSGGINNIPFTEMFVGEDNPAYPFDETGFFPKPGVRFVETGNGKKCRELYLAARPAEAKPAEQRLRARLSAEKLSPQGVVDAGAAQGQSVDLHVPSSNPNDPYVSPVPSGQKMDFQMERKMITSSRWAGIKDK